MTTYLASRYGRREELCGYRQQLQAIGHVVNSRWLDGPKQILGVAAPLGADGEKLVESDSDADTEESMELKSLFADRASYDIVTSNLFIAFTEPPRSTTSRGGRMVELGIALALRKRIIVVGYRENIFCYLPQVRFFATWDAALKVLTNQKEFAD